MWIQKARGIVNVPVAWLSYEEQWREVYLLTQIWVSIFNSGVLP